MDKYLLMIIIPFLIAPFTAFVLIEAQDRAIHASATIEVDTIMKTGNWVNQPSHEFMPWWGWVAFSGIFIHAGIVVYAGHKLGRAT